MARRSRIACIVVIVFVTALSHACLFAQDKTPRSVWDGIYTNAQAQRGEMGYREACASCHGAQLDGSGQIPPLAGSDFTMNWNGMSVSDLFEKIQTSMPADKPGTLSKVQNAAILAYIFQFNKFPAGSAELPGDTDALKEIRFEADKSKR